MIVYPGNIGNGCKILLQGSGELRPRHAQGQCAVTQAVAVVRLHGLMQHDLLVQPVGLARQHPGEGGLRQKGVSHCPRQGQGTLPRHQLVAQIIDDQSYFHPARR